MIGGYQTALLGVIAGGKRQILDIPGGFDTSLGAQRSDIIIATSSYTETNRRVQTSATTGEGGYQSRGYRSRDSGKFYYEFDVDVVGNVTVIGWFVNDTPLSEDVNGAGNTGISDAWYVTCLNGAWSVGGTFASGTLSGSGAAVYMFAVDFAAGKLWIGLNGTWQGGGDPAAGTGALCTGASFAAGSPGITQRGGFGTCDARLLTTAAELTYSPPSGFDPYSTEV